MRGLVVGVGSRQVERGSGEGVWIGQGHVGGRADADVAIVDQQEQWEVDPTKFRSKSRNTPFAGWKVKGRVTTTIVGGRVVFEADQAEP